MIKTQPRFSFSSLTPLLADGTQEAQDPFVLTDANGNVLASLDYLGNFTSATNIQPYKLPVANLGSANPTTNVSGAAQTAGTITIPANSLVPGNIVRVTGQLVGVTRTSSDTTAVTLAFGSVTLTLAAAFAHATTNFLTFYVDFVVLTVGASGTILAAGMVDGGTVGATPLGVSAGSTALNTTTSMPITLGITFSANNTSDQIAINNLHAEVL